MITIDVALLDKNLLGAALDDVKPWQRTWTPTLRAAFGLPLDEDELNAFHAVAGERGPPSKRVRELWCVVGRRGGKSRMAAAIAVYVACFVKHKLAAGETGFVLVLAASRDQALLVFKYALAFLEASPVLKQEIASVTQTEIRLKSGVVIATHANSFRSIRGRTLLCAIFDEVALWRDEVSATPDLEVYRAVLPALMTTKGILIGISTPYRKIGLLYQKHRDHFATDGDAILVVQGPSTAFNPTLQQSEIDAAIGDDPEGARAEWEATFRADLAAFLSDDLIDDAIDHDRPLEIPYGSNLKYTAFVDASAGRHDGYAICIGHKSKSGAFVADVVRVRRPPFTPTEVTAEYAQLLKDYKLTRCTGDRFAGEWATSAFSQHGIVYENSEKPKTELYLESLPLWTRSAISIPNHPQLVREPDCWSAPPIAVAVTPWITHAEARMTPRIAYVHAPRCPLTALTTA